MRYLHVLLCGLLIPDFNLENFKGPICKKSRFILGSSKTDALGWQDGSAAVPKRRVGTETQ